MEAKGEGSTKTLFGVKEAGLEKAFPLKCMEEGRMRKESKRMEKMIGRPFATMIAVGPMGDHKEISLVAFGSMTRYRRETNFPLAHPTVSIKAKEMNRFWLQGYFTQRHRNGM